MTIYFLLPMISRATIINAPDYFIQSFGIPDGLPHEMAHHIVQDQTGFLWISTSSGLVRYDGNEFQTITSPLLNNQQSDLLYAITRGTNGNLYAAPNIGGLVEFDAKTKSFRQIVSADLLPPRPPAFLVQTADGAFWLGNFLMELRRYKDGRVTLFTNGFTLGQTISLATDASNQIWVASDAILAKFQDGRLVRMPFNSAGPPPYSSGKSRLGRGTNGKIWLATPNSLQKIEHDETVVMTTNVLWAASQGIPTAVLEDSSGVVWVGTRGQGLYHYADGVFHKLPTSHPWITDLFEDNEGNLWAATHGGGIDRIRLKTFSDWNFQAGIVEDGVNSVCANPRGDFWMTDVTEANNKIVELPKGGHKQEFKNGLINSLRIACLDSNNNLWIGTRGAILKWQISTNFDPQVAFREKDLSPHALYCADNGDMWASGDYAFLGRWHDNHWESFDVVKTNGDRVMVSNIAEDGDQNVWIALGNGDLLRYRDGQFKYFDTRDGLPGSAVHCMLRDSRGWLWMTTTRDGLLLRHDQRFYRVTTKQGFPSGVIDQMQEDNFGRIWVATEVGFYHLDREELIQCALGKIPEVHPVAFGREVGLVGYSPVSNFQPISWKSRDGLLVFTTHKGVISIDPSQCHTDTNLPPVLVDEILVNDEPISPGNDIQLTHDAKKIEFKISAIEFSAPGRVKVRHWLEGFDSKWIDEGNERLFSYPKLPPGKYVLKFGACNPAGLWNDKVAPLAITVVPAW
ncbi:MAG TPA: two-component regulator propeller domain-containing protein, partial [Desulfuromonadaceae bacterium]|nr:two-component regulator propeller domain-containing protein [Desulfuromonadaceae bacterium]